MDIGSEIVWFNLYLLNIKYPINMVSNKCSVPGCQQSSSSKFGVPQNDHKAWEKKIGIVLNRNSRVCAHHFNTYYTYYFNIYMKLVSKYKSSFISNGWKVFTVYN